MEKIIVYRKDIIKTNVEETIQRCLTPYEDKLSADLNSENDHIRNRAAKDLKIEKMMAEHTDTFLPERFKGKGYNRLRAIYAYPFKFPENWCYPNFIPYGRSSVEGETVMKMAVEGSSALVLPMKEITEFYHQNSSDTNGGLEGIKKYWESAVSLEEFPKDFINPSQREYIWYFKYGLGRIESPEVLIPEWALENVEFVGVLDKAIEI